MTRCAVMTRGLLAAGCGLLLGGCYPPPGTGDQTRGERFYSVGKSRVQQQDFTGAVAAFEQALLADPQLARAHYDLATVFDRDLGIPEKALYHYVRALELNPQLPGADLISNRVGVVKMNLAQGATPSLGSPQLLAEIERLGRELDGMRIARDAALVENQKLNEALALARPMPAAPVDPPGSRVESHSATDQSGTIAGQNAGSSGGRAPVAATTRPYVIQKGDTIFGLSRRFQITKDALLAANPGISERNFQIGRTIQVPVK